MAYNLYQVQMANAWVERINKENAQAEAFWTQQALKATGPPSQAAGRLGGKAASVARSTVTSAVPSGYTSKSSALKDRLTKLEQELENEKTRRRQIEDELSLLQTMSSSASNPRV